MKTLSMTALAVVMLAPTLALSQPWGPGGQGQGMGPGMGPGAGQDWQARREAHFKSVDQDGNGVVTTEELAKANAKRTETFLTRHDQNKDGQVSREEFLATAPTAGGGGPGGGDGCARWNNRAAGPR